MVEFGDVGGDVEDEGNEEGCFFAGRAGRNKEPKIEGGACEGDV